MLSGARAFHRDSAAETMSAILREEPPDLSATNKNVQPGLERIVRHCLEKNPRRVSIRRATSRSTSRRSPACRARAPWLPPTAVAAAARPGNGLGPRRRRRRGCRLLVPFRKGPAGPPSFHQLTFRRGDISSARFGSDGKSVLYSAGWDGGAIEIHLGEPTVRTRPFGLKNADVLAVSRRGRRQPQARASGAFTRAGTLARGPRPAAALPERSSRRRVRGLPA